MTTGRKIDSVETKLGPVVMRYDKRDGMFSAEVFGTMLTDKDSIRLKEMIRTRVTTHSAPAWQPVIEISVPGSDGDLDFRFQRYYLGKSGLDTWMRVGWDVPVDQRDQRMEEFREITEDVFDIPWRDYEERGWGERARTVLQSVWLPYSEDDWQTLREFNQAQKGLHAFLVGLLEQDPPAPAQMQELLQTILVTAPFDEPKEEEDEEDE